MNRRKFLKSFIDSILEKTIHLSDKDFVIYIIYQMHGILITNIDIKEPE
jgi:hypothetical protein